jgi:hypothetical protein
VAAHVQVVKPALSLRSNPAVTVHLSNFARRKVVAHLRPPLSDGNLLRRSRRSTSSPVSQFDAVGTDVTTQ